MKGFVVEVDLSQTESRYILVEGSKTFEEARQTVLVSDITNCPRLYRGGYIDSVIKMKPNNE